ncbi:MAG: hypothetical protein ACLT8I_23635 [Blautia faecis]
MRKLNTRYTAVSTLNADLEYCIQCTGMKRAVVVMEPSTSKTVEEQA